MGARDFVVVTFVIALCGAVALRAQQHETAQDIDDGGRVFRNTCANCHGPDGDEVAGIDLGPRRLSSREDRSGSRSRSSGAALPGTAMPASDMPVAQAEQIVAYLRSIAAAKRSRRRTPATSNAANRCSKAKARALTCHRVNGVGARLGPDLSNVGQLAAGHRTRDVDRRSGQGNLLHEPHVSRGHEGRPDVTGRLLNLDSFTILMLDSEGAAAIIREVQPPRLSASSTSSPMPSYRES